MGEIGAMKDFLIKKFGRETLKKHYYTVISLLNSKYRKSLRKVKSNFIDVDEKKADELYKVLLQNYFNVTESTYELSKIQQEDLDEHMFNRLSTFRYRIIPWLDVLVSLNKSKVLEIGCGTGCTTIALAEQGCELTSIDLSDLTTVKKRCQLYGVSANILNMNATQICELDDAFDLIIFAESMEHMTYKERIESIKSAWSILKDGGFLVVLGAPNRLNYYDRHSSLLHFYHWLPDELAMQYSKYSERDACVQAGNNEMDFIRFGRAVSFHEFEIALDARCSDLECFCVQSFMNTPVFSSIVFRQEYKFRNVLMKLGPPNIPEGFYYETLNIALKKS